MQTNSPDPRIEVVVSYLIANHFELDYAKSLAPSFLAQIDKVDPLRTLRVQDEQKEKSSFKQYDTITAALVALAKRNIPTDIQEILLFGDNEKNIAPGALQKAIESSVSVSEAYKSKDNKIGPNCNKTSRDTLLFTVAQILCDHFYVPDSSRRNLIRELNRHRINIENIYGKQ